MSSKDNQTISKTFIKEKGKLFGWIRNRVSDSYEAEDILQDVFYQLSVGFQDLRTAENITSWLYRVAGNKIIDHFRKKKVKNFSTHDFYLDEEDENLSISDILPAIENTPDELELHEILWERIEYCLDEMPEEQAEVFIMHELEDKSFREISSITGIGINTLLSRKRYAILFLRDRLKSVYKQFKNE